MINTFKYTVYQKVLSILLSILFALSMLPFAAEEAENKAARRL